MPVPVSTRALVAHAHLKSLLLVASSILLQKRAWLNVNEALFLGMWADVHLLQRSFWSLGIPTC